MDQSGPHLCRDASICSQRGLARFLTTPSLHGGPRAKQAFTQIFKGWSATTLSGWLLLRALPKRLGDTFSVLGTLPVNPICGRTTWVPKLNVWVGLQPL
jgi:hypothetical protein